MQERAQRQGKDGSKGGEKRTAQFEYKLNDTTFAKDLQNQRFRDSYIVTYKIQQKTSLILDYKFQICEHMWVGWIKSSGLSFKDFLDQVYKNVLTF